MSAVLEGGFATPAVEAALAFRAVMQALARPGRIETVAGALPPAPCSMAAGVVLLTLLDPTTPLYLAPSHDHPALRDWIAFHTGAPLAAPADAMFALGDWAALQPVTRFAIGTDDYPDRSATLIVEMDRLEGQGARLAGPGIAGQALLSLPETAAFRANRDLFPLGFDTILTCGDRLAGLPRSTRVEG